MKQYKFIILLLLLFFPHTFLFASENPAYNANAYDAKVTDISGRKYFPAVMDAINKAEKSINVVMYIISYNPQVPRSKTGELLDALVEASKRGVDVTIIIDKNKRFVSDFSSSKNTIDKKNIWAYEKLKKAGIEVYYDDRYKLTHAKTIVIDKNTVINGSANWSNAAFDSNNEINHIIKSKAIAADAMKYIHGVKLLDKDENLPFDKNRSIKIPIGFIESKGKGSRLFSSRDKRGFKLYLFLLKEFDGNNEGRILLDYDKAAKLLGLYTTKSRKDYREEITRVMRRLEKKYSLIKFQHQYEKDAIITLLDSHDKKVIYKIPEEDYFIVPYEFWEYGWIKEFTLRAMFCYLINLAYISESDISPIWSEPKSKILHRFYISHDALNNGIQELRRLNLIDILYRAYNNEKEFFISYTNKYVVLPLYKIEKLKEQWKKIKLKHGEDMLERARKYAKIIAEENDPVVVKDIIYMINNHGDKIVKKAFRIVSPKITSNPKKNYDYVKGIVRSMAEEVESKK